MKYEIYEMMVDLSVKLDDAKAIFRVKNADASVEIWKPDDYRKAECMFENVSRLIRELETFFCDGDEILPEEERARLEREFLEDLVADEMLEG